VFEVEVPSLITSVKVVDLPAWVREHPLDLACLGIDIPIGLLKGLRAHSKATRKLLGQPSGNSVFPAPCRLVTRCIFADFQNQVWGGNSPLERTNGVFGIEHAVSIMDGPELSEKRRKELSLALLMSETIGVMLYESDSDMRIKAVKDMVRKFRHVCPEIAEI
jgi:Protein of unknown function (DUF429)